MPTQKDECQWRLDALADIAIGIYAPMPLSSLRFLLRRLRFAAPQWESDVTAAVERARERLAHTEIDGVRWYWPAEENPKESVVAKRVYLLAPFDPVVWDRDRFERLWRWVYRFEAYTPRAKRVRGYYALPMLWRERVIGWGNVTVDAETLDYKFGYVANKPKERAFTIEIEAELERMKSFLGIGGGLSERGNGSR